MTDYDSLYRNTSKDIHQTSQSMHGHGARHNGASGPIDATGVSTDQAFSYEHIKRDNGLISHQKITTQDVDANGPKQNSS